MGIVRCRCNCQEQLSKRLNYHWPLSPVNKSGTSIALPRSEDSLVSRLSLGWYNGTAGCCLVNGARSFNVANEVRCRCKHCGRELKPSHTGKCPYCGESGKECIRIETETVGVKDSVERAHETHMSPESWEILILLISLVLGAANSPILILMSQWYRFLVSIAATIILLLLMLRLRKSYRFITLCNNLVRSASGKRKFRS